MTGKEKILETAKNKIKLITNCQTIVKAGMSQKRSDTVAQFNLLILQTGKLLFLPVVPDLSS